MSILHRLEWLGQWASFWERSAKPADRGLFSTLTRRRRKRGVFRSIADLHAAISGYIADHSL
jgi:hypothetical protein